MGYIGPCVVERLRSNNPLAEIVGYDIGYFAHCLTGVQMFPECRVDKQYFGDVRDIPEEAFRNVTSVVYLAAISNDPMGNAFEKPTLDINYRAALKAADKAKSAGVSSFVFAASCSMYGSSLEGYRREHDQLNPLTAYAESKVYCERDLECFADHSFAVTSLRFSTACGMSNRLRLDLVLNDFVASAIVSGKINILSDGTPWRPLIHIKDMAKAVDWAVTRKYTNGGAFLVVNVGSNNWNYQVKELAEAVADIIPGTDISIDRDAQPDKRSYKVDFEMFERLAPDYQPTYGLESAIKELEEGLMEMGFNTPDFRDTWFMRLKVLKDHIANNILDSNLCWSKKQDGDKQIYPLLLTNPYMIET